MPCDPLVADDGTVMGFVCSRGQRRRTCSVCKQRPSTKLCDFKLSGSKQGKTCDAPLCDQCAVQQAVTVLPESCAGKRLKPDTVDFCPAHDRLMKSKEGATP